MRSLALTAITGYQRYVSPYKGFCCAYGFHTGHRSCSVLGYRAIRAHGILRGLAILRLRFERCGAAHAKYGNGLAGRTRQRGVCDIGCVPCDIPAIDCAPSACDLASCAPTPCDCASLWNSKKGTPYVPPQRQKEHEVAGEASRFQP